MSSVHVEHCIRFYLYPHPRFQSRTETQTSLNLQGAASFALKDGGLGKGGRFFQFYLACDVHVAPRALVEGGRWARGVTTPGGQTDDLTVSSLLPLPEVLSFNLPGPSPTRQQTAF